MSKGKADSKIKNCLFIGREADGFLTYGTNTTSLRQTAPTFTRKKLFKQKSSASSLVRLTSSYTDLTQIIAFKLSIYSITPLFFCKQFLHREYNISSVDRLKLVNNYLEISKWNLMNYLKKIIKHNNLGVNFLG